MPATPKPPGQRRRRNVDQPQWKQLPAEGREGDAPVLPAKRPAWLKPTREWWVRAWASPMAAVWLESDLDTLIRLARLMDEVNRDPSTASLHAQVTSLEDRLGLSPGARRRLQWEVSQAESKRESSKPATVTRLRAVDAAA